MVINNVWGFHSSVHKVYTFHTIDILNLLSSDTIYVSLLLSIHLKSWGRRIQKQLSRNWDFIVLLKHTYGPCSDIIIFYWTAIRPVLAYFGPVFHHLLSQHLTEDIKRVQKRILSIFCLQVSYSECLVRFGLTTLHARHLALCHKLLNPIMSCPRHKPLPLLP